MSGPTVEIVVIVSVIAEYHWGARSHPQDIASIAQAVGYTVTSGIYRDGGPE